MCFVYGIVMSQAWGMPSGSEPPPTMALPSPDTAKTFSSRQPFKSSL
jgi:hypothetical protein